MSVSAAALFILKINRLKTLKMQDFSCIFFVNSVKNWQLKTKLFGEYAPSLAQCYVVRAIRSCFVASVFSGAIWHMRKRFFILTFCLRVLTLSRVASEH